MLTLPGLPGTSRGAALISALCAASSIVSFVITISRRNYRLRVSKTPLGHAVSYYLSIFDSCFRHILIPIVALSSMASSSRLFLSYCLPTLYAHSLLGLLRILSWGMSRLVETEASEGIRG